MRRFLKNKKGFTLIELIVVIAILGILSAIAVPRVAGFQETARTRANEANIVTLRNAATIAVTENGAPTSDVTWTGAGTGTGVYLANTYIQNWPASPWTGGTGYTVTITGTTGAVAVTGGH